MYPLKFFLRRATASGLTELLRTSPVLGELGDVAKTGIQAPKELTLKVRGSGSEAIELPHTVLANVDEAGSAEIRQVPRCRRLHDIEDCHQIGDAKLAVLEDVEYPKPRPVGKSAEHQVDADDGEPFPPSSPCCRGRFHYAGPIGIPPDGVRRNRWYSGDSTRATAAPGVRPAKE